MGHRLAESSSLYLRQHAENPVDWHPWGPEPFEEARSRDVPVFISIGYAACHWCHVMAGESFQDESVAETLNSRFVAIKVDREEHPDVDDTYMAATQTLTGQGGCPMSVFTLPDGRVFHAGTYFPPQRRGRIPAFGEVLDAVHLAWTERREEVEESAAKIAQALGSQRRQQAQLGLAVPEADASEGTAAGTASSPTQSIPGSIPASSAEQWAQDALAVLAEEEDSVHGGFGAAPKFPPSPLLGFLLEESPWTGARNEAHDVAGGLAVRTLEAMGRSALFDQLDGGFARYATDRAWALPHFEKMLYDNAQLLGHCARLGVHPAADADQRRRADRCARMTTRWLQRRMRTDEGLFASSLDADTVQADGSHVEGGTYLFTDEEIIDAAREGGCTVAQAQRLAELSRGVPTEGGHVGPEVPRTVHFNAPLDEEDQRLWDTVAATLLQRRDQRLQPGRDEKVVAAWNAMAVRSLAEASMLWGEQDPLELALEVAEKLWDVHTQQVDPEGALDHRVSVARVSYRGRTDGRSGTLGDHAELAQACFALSSAAGSRLWLERGVAVLRHTVETFVSHGAQNGWQVVENLDDDGLLRAAHDGPLLAGPLDSPEPSAQASLAAALQTAEALEMHSVLPTSGADEPLRAADLLSHLDVTAAKVPSVVGASLQVARRAARGSPALRMVSGSQADVVEVRRAAALAGVPVEPMPEGVPGEGEQPSISLCLSAPSQMVCLPPVDSANAALAQVSS